ncbi:MAG: hypothetical protein WAQ52_08715 [Terriglobales bacterium]
MNEISEKEFNAAVVSAAEVFVKITPDYKASPENRDKIIAKILELELKPTNVANWEIAYSMACADEIVYEHQPLGFNGEPDPLSPKLTYTGLAAIDAMPAEGMKRRLKEDPRFRRGVHALLGDASGK